MICTEKLPVPPIRGGAIQTYITGALPHLSLSHQVTVIGREDPDLPAEEVRGGIRHIRVEAGRSPWVYGANVADVLAGERFDVLHMFNRPLLVPLFAAQAPDSALVLSLHNEMLAPEKISADSGARVVDRLDRIVTISDFVRYRSRERFPAAGAKARTIYSAADTDQFLPRWDPQARAGAAEMRAALGLGDRPVVLYVGRLSAKKGAHVVIEAVRRLQRERYGTALVVVGSKWYGRDDDPDPYIEGLHEAAARLDPPALFTGYVPYTDVHRYFWLADVFVCASQWREPLSRTLFEAMAAGAPIVTTDRGGNAEVVDGWRNGVVLPDVGYDQPGAMARTIGRLLRHPDRAQRMGRIGRMLAVERYNWPRVARDIEAVYRGLL